MLHVFFPESPPGVLLSSSLSIRQPNQYFVSQNLSMEAPAGKRKACSNDD